MGKEKLVVYSCNLWLILMIYALLVMWGIRIYNRNLNHSKSQRQKLHYVPSNITTIDCSCAHLISLITYLLGKYVEDLY